jgi:hypothetical protein
MTTRIVVRLFVDLTAEDAVESFGRATQERIAPFGDMLEAGAKRYWKVPTWFEVFAVLKPRTEPHLAFVGVLSALGQAWERRDISAEEAWAVWNPKPEAGFFSPRVQWANVVLFPEASIVSS